VDNHTFNVLPDDYMRQLGLIVLQSDITLEDEIRHYFEDHSVSILANRIPFENDVTAATLQQMEGHLAHTMSLFPIGMRFDSFGYACTSGALHIGSEAIAAAVSEIRPAFQVTNPLLAAVTACQSIGAKTIAFLAPYAESVSQTMVDAFEADGIRVTHAATFNESEDRIVGRIDPESIYASAVSLIGLGEVDAVFMACTNMKCATVIPRIEQDTGIYALSSNQVLAWHMARLAGLEKISSAKGKLFTH
jgi:maleate isomerase